jgi:serine protease AprX
MMMSIRLWVSAISIALGSVAAASSAADSTSPGDRQSALTPALYIVQAESLHTADKSVVRVNAKVEQEFEIIHSVSAYLTPKQVARLRATNGIRVYADRPVSERGLLGNLTSLTNNVVSSTNNIVASSAVGVVTGQVVAPVASAVVTNSLVSGITSPAVANKSVHTTLTDGTGVQASTAQYQTDYPALVGADSLQQAGITGKGVTIAILDSGIWQDLGQNYGGRILASVDVTNGGSGTVTSDPYGHGTHVTSIAAGGAQNMAGGYLGIAPKANLVIVRAFDGNGGGRYVDVISGMNWIVAHQKQYSIRVVNLSFGAQPESYYWDDPLNQAVMAAWKAGIVVVAASGNEGPDPMTIDVPGNVPYVVTVGALTDNYTPYDGSDDRLASFSSTGPTFEGFVKPEIVAPGGHIVASMSPGSYLANIDKNSMRPNQTLFTMSGTSMAAAVTTGVVALMIQSDPTLTPDAVKCRLMSSAHPAINSNGTLAYSVFQQGAGLMQLPPSTARPRAAPTAV